MFVVENFAAGITAGLSTQSEGEGDVGEEMGKNGVEEGLREGKGRDGKGIRGNGRRLGRREEGGAEGQGRGWELWSGG